jgi:ATP synthase protein I
MTEPSKTDEQLEHSVETQRERMQKAERERPTLLAQTAFLGTLGLLFVLPVVGGAYLGVWLDNLLESYSVSWTTSLIFVGVIIGGINVWLFIRD